MEKQILLNRAKCLLCGEIIYSNYVGDYKTCKCGNLSVDGGFDYQTIIYRKDNSWENLSEFYIEEEQQNGEKSI